LVSTIWEEFEVQPRINHSFITSAVFKLLCVVGVLIACGVSVLASASGRVVVRDEMKTAHRLILLEKLRLITGYRQMGFDREGVLMLGSVEAGGSSSARELLARAVTGDKFVILEDATDRADVVFCRVVPGKAIGANPSTLPVFVVLIDFEDFKHVRGDARARAAFDVGWGILHELDHVVSESEDSTNGSVGPCEEHINQMRREMGLPIRSTYFFNSLPARTDPNFITRLVRLGFVETDSLQKKTKRYWLIWDAALVGVTDEGREATLVKSASLQ